MEVEKAFDVSNFIKKFKKWYLIDRFSFQLAHDIIGDLRSILQEVRSKENQLRYQQKELESTLERALEDNGNF